ncbi:MAG: nucleoside triphosphate pyrophosphatase [Halioglobus sp.]
MDLILASTSPYRRELLQRLDVPFQCISPNVDEAALPGEQPQELARRLALKKAQAVSPQYPGSLVIGSDQVAALDGRLLGKPGTHGAAREQLRNCSGREVLFFTGVALVCARSRLVSTHVEPFKVRFRNLQEAQIENYLRREEPYDCAGSFKCEGLGIVLFEQLSGNDPTSLQGLPLIALTTMLKNSGNISII